MSLKELLEEFPWYRYSKKLRDKIYHPRSNGYFTKEDSKERNVRFVEGSAGSIKEGNYIKLYWLVDPEDGTIIDAKFQAFGQTALIGAAEAACETLISKNYDQAMRLSFDLIDRQVRDRQDTEAFPKESYPHLNLVLEAILSTAQLCTDIPLPTAYVAPPVPSFEGMEGAPYPGWDDLPLKQKIAVIETVLDQDIRPYIALDAGGVEILNLLNDRQLIITYQGTCTSCYSAIGTTLSYIQQVLRTKVHPEITVIPDLDFDSPY